MKNPESGKYRFSIGDQVIFTVPLLDKKGGTRQGRLYVVGTVVSGRTFRDVSVETAGTYVLTDKSQINVAGHFSFSGDLRLAIVGGTGRYENARGTLTSVEDKNHNSKDILTLLP